VSADTLTKAQAELLRWLIEAEKSAAAAREKHGYPPQRAEFSGGSLISYYAERTVARRTAEYAAKGEPMPSWESHPRGGYADHGWRRTGGLQLRRLADKGYLRQTQIIWGTPQYVLTDEGRAAVE
jgi:hypothetical protein